ncbi:MAG TPA: tryptophan--tRNA ligase [candidate division Zixibacteria bacterium]|nr:tryptophan--tRNA ligase [candidate division Zixibacteria bacterium]
MKNETILSGMQPTGALHIGNLEGALKNWVNLQNDYNMYCCIVDWHALTEDYKDTGILKERIYQVAVDFLAAGLDPEKCAIFIQSNIKEHAELHLIFSMLITVPTLTRLPTYTDKKEELGLDSYGFLGYPVLQAADICVYNADKVPVGKDQEKHIWLAADLAKRFNNIYGETLREPQVLLTKVPLIPGTDGRKMSKSLGNHIMISDTENTTVQKLKKMFTDPEKLRKNDPGHPEICPVFALHHVYSENPNGTIAPPCRTGELGCVDCKAKLTINLNRSLAPIREKRVVIENNKDYIWDVLKSGAARARERASAVMESVRSAMKTEYF